MQSITEELKNQLISPTLDLTKEYAEIGIDYLLEEGVLKDIPIVSLITGIYKAGMSIRNIHFIRKLLVFIKEFQLGNIEQDKLLEFREKLVQDDKYKAKVTEQIIIYIERFDKDIKAKIYGKLFTAYVNKIFEWDIFIFLTSCIDNLFLSDLKILKDLYAKNEPIAASEFDLDSFDINMVYSSLEKIRSLGLIKYETNELILGECIYRKFMANNVGGIFCRECIINNEF